MSNQKKVEGNNHSNQTDEITKKFERTQKHDGLDISESNMSKEEFEQYFQNYQENKL